MGMISDGIFSTAESTRLGYLPFTLASMSTSNTVATMQDMLRILGWGSVENTSGTSRQKDL